MKLLKPKKNTTKKNTTKQNTTSKQRKRLGATAKQYLEDEIMVAAEDEDDLIYEVPPLPPPLHFIMPPSTVSNPPVSYSLPSSSISNQPSPPVTSNPPIFNLPSPVTSNPPIYNQPSHVASKQPVSNLPSSLISDQPVSVATNPSSLTIYPPSSYTRYPPSSTIYPPSSFTGYHPPPSTSYPPSSFTGYHPPSSTSYPPSSFTGYHPPSSTSYPPSSFTRYHPPPSTSYSPSSFTGYLHPPPSTSYPPSGYNHQPYASSTIYPLSSTTSYNLHSDSNIWGRLDTMEKQLSALEDRVTLLEESEGPIPTEETTSRIPGITREKMMAVNIILSNKTIGWKAALRKILVGVFGVNKLSQSCAKGKKNAQNKSLDPQMVRSITGNNICTIIITILFMLFFIDILYQRYGDSCVDLRPESINTVINSACSGARRSLKDCPPCP